MLFCRRIGEVFERVVFEDVGPPDALSIDFQGVFLCIETSDSEEGSRDLDPVRVELWDEGARKSSVSTWSVVAGNASTMSGSRCERPVSARPFFVPLPMGSFAHILLSQALLPLPNPDPIALFDDRACSLLFELAPIPKPTNGFLVCCKRISRGR